MSDTQTPDETESRCIDRRTVLKTTAAAGAAAAVGPRITYNVRATDSGYVEITTSATIRTDTSLDITANEDIDGDGVAENKQTVSIGDGTNTYALDQLEGAEGEDVTYWWDLSLSSADGSNTPSLDSLSVDLPPESASTGTSIDGEWREKPDHVNIYYDKAKLEEYQPLLVMDSETRTRYKAMFGYIAESTEYEYDVYCYWSQLTHQDGLPMVDADSHLGDHEPVYVFVEKDTGDVAEIRYSAGHWHAAVLPSEEADLVQARTSSGTHVRLKVHSKYSHHSYAPNSDGVFVDIRSWLSYRDEWIDNGFYEAASEEAVENPARMRSRDTWFDEGTRDAFIASFWRQMGAYGFSDADPLAVDGEQVTAETAATADDGDEDSGGGLFGFSFDFWPFN